MIVAQDGKDAGNRLPARSQQQESSLRHQILRSLQAELNRARADMPLMSWILPTAVAIALAVAAAGVWLRRQRIRTRSLEAQVRWYRRALHFAGVGVWQWDMRTLDWHWVQPFHLQGANERYLLPAGDDYFVGVHPEDLDGYHAAEQACIRQERSLRSEYRYVLPTGEIRWIRDVGDVVRDRDGTALRMYGISLDVTAEREQALDQERRSRLDDLTGIPNRRALVEHLREAVARPTDLTVGFIDLNGFKALNDRLGHAAGDECLRRIGMAFRRICREGDLAARVGGDEFVLVIDCAADGRAAGRQRIEDLVRQILHEVNDADPRLQLGAATGIAHFPADGRDPRSLIDAADAAMYRAKSTGERVAFASAGSGGPGRVAAA